MRYCFDFLIHSSIGKTPFKTFNTFFFHKSVKYLSLLRLLGLNVSKIGNSPERMQLKNYATSRYVISCVTTYPIQPFFSTKIKDEKINIYTNVLFNYTLWFVGKLTQKNLYHFYAPLIIKIFEMRFLLLMLRV